MTDEPTDEALENLFVEETGFDIDDFPAAIFDFARAVLAKWGTPAPVGVGEVAERYRNAIASACEGWTMPDGLRKHLETALWSQPTPQPTQAQAAESVREDAAWMPLTPELLTAIESGDLGNRFWIAAHNSNEPQIGVYEWRQGRNPHGFNSDLSRYGASEITHVLPYKPPALPAASSPQARSKP